MQSADTTAAGPVKVRSRWTTAATVAAIAAAAVAGGLLVASIHRSPVIVPKVSRLEPDAQARPMGRATTVHAALRSELATRRAQTRPGRAEVATIRAEVLTLSDSWRRVLAEDPVNARPIITSLLTKPVTIAPVEAKRRWTLTGEGTLSGLFQREIFQKVVRPHAA